MTPQQALKMLDDMVANTKETRAMHGACVLAIQVLQQAILPNTRVEKKKEQVEEKTTEQADKD